MTTEKKILVVGREKKFVKLLSEMFTEDGHRVVNSFDGVGACQKVQNEKFDLVITDIELPQKNGTKYLTDLKSCSANQELHIIAFGDSADDLHEDLKILKDVKFLIKPIQGDVLHALGSAMISPRKKADSVAEKVVLKEGEILINEGELGDKMFWLGSGALEVFTKNDEGIEIILGCVSEGELIGEMSFLDNEIRSASVRALSNCLLLVIPGDKFLNILEGQPAWFHSLVKNLSARLRITSKKVII